jgi:hypothetical protein
MLQVMMVGVRPGLGVSKHVGRWTAGQVALSTKLIYFSMSTPCAWQALYFHRKAILVAALLALKFMRVFACLRPVARQE